MQTHQPSILLAALVSFFESVAACDGVMRQAELDYSERAIKALLGELESASRSFPNLQHHLARDSDYLSVLVGLPHSAKLQLIEHAWHLAQCDGWLDAHEEIRIYNWSDVLKVPRRALAELQPNTEAVPETEGLEPVTPAFFRRQLLHIQSQLAATMS